MPSTLLAHDHIPRTGKRQPVSTYRIQLSPEFGFNQANKLLPYLDFLGITDVYLSPILQAAPGSNHGYDVVDHSRISTDLGGEDAFVALAESIHRANMGLVVDVVPNHMAFPTPLYHNRQLWSVLRYGHESPYVKWFDIETEEPILLPILAEPIGKVLTEGQLEVQDLQVPDTQLEPQQVLRYFNHIFPLAEGTSDLPLEVLLEKQNYRLAHWEITNEELNYRRFLTSEV
ncbi:alpha-amylase family glycosyl hydrolase [uncultured Mobiluncus sp.]|uniref:alpha-amylase family glycosyl hydrolase n=1 Tax=uncultured Mobiluncus sp. TaxID=293425 RepID=UPI0025F28DEF|nr:alpha-amylase family glycosyl hydrolase [uncultured Mobiluncus sp.]